MDEPDIRIPRSPADGHPTRDESRESGPAGGDNGATGRRKQRRTVVLLLYVLVTSAVLTVFLVRPGVEGYPRATFADLIHGQAYRPFAGRILVPTLVRGVCAVTPDTFERYVARHFEHRRFVRTLVGNPEGTYEYLASLALMACCFVGTLYVWRSLVTRFYHYPGHVADVAPVIGLLSLTVFFRYLSYIYDPATLLLFSAGILALHVRTRGLFFIVFTLSALNKETSVLLIPLYLIRNHTELPRRRLVFHAATLSVLWISLRAFVAYLVRQNPGRTLETHLIDHNLRLPWLHPFSLAYTVVIFAFAVWLVRRGWKTKPSFLRTGLLVTVVPLFVGSLFFGYVDELRGYYESFPFLFLLSLPSLCSVLGVAEDDAATPR